MKDRSEDRADWPRNSCNLSSTHSCSRSKTAAPRRTWKRDGAYYRKCVIRGHRVCVAYALAEYELSDEQREITQRMSDRLGLKGEPVQPDLIGMEADTEPLPVGPPPPIGDGSRFPSIRRSAEFLQAQPWLVPSVERLCEWELRSIGRPRVRQLKVTGRVVLSEIWEPLCAWAKPLRRDKPGQFRLARRAAEYLVGDYPWDAEWNDEASGVLPEEIREALEREAKVILDYARDTGCKCSACVSRREEVATATRRFKERYG